MLIFVEPLNHPDVSFSHKALCPSVSKGVRRLVESLLDAKVWPVGQQIAVTLQETPAVFCTSMGDFEEHKDKRIPSEEQSRSTTIIWSVEDI